MFWAKLVILSLLALPIGTPAQDDYNNKANIPSASQIIQKHNQNNLNLPLNDESGPLTITLTYQQGVTTFETNKDIRGHIVKLTPDIGPSYYFIDRERDGVIETRFSEYDELLVLANWVILEW